MAKALRPERIWAHLWGCGAVVASEERPDRCACKAEAPRFDDMGYRVGQHQGNYAIYSTYETAARDRRCK